MRSGVCASRSRAGGREATANRAVQPVSHQELPTKCWTRCDPTHCIYQRYSDPTQPTADWSRDQTFGTVSQPEIWSRLRFGRGSQFWSRSQSGPRLTSLQELPITQLRQDNATGHQRRRYSQRYSRVGSTRRCGLLLLWPVINDSAPVNVDLAISLYHILDTMSVCLSVCPRAYLGNHSPIFGACHLRPWLGSHFAAMRYVMYFRFCWWRHALSHPRYGLIPFTYLFHRWRCGTLLSNYERLMTSLWSLQGGYVDWRTSCLLVKTWKTH